MGGLAHGADGARLTARLEPYVPHVVLRHLVGRPGAAVHTLDATLLFADISGFTKLSERLARRGREGAEELVGAIGTSLSALLGVAHADGGSLLKLSGDALLLLFEGERHLARASRSALGMRRMLRDVGRLQTSAGKVTLRMSQGLHSGELHLFLVGGSHRELLVAGRGSTLVTLMEKAADAGEVVVSAETAVLLPAACVGATKGPGHLLAGAPAGGGAPPAPAGDLPDADQLATALSTEVRAHVLAEHRAPEHRHATAAFIRFEGTDAVIAEEGPEAGAAALHELVDAVQRAADEHQVCFLESDVDVDGGKLMMVAGAPRMVGDDEERMLLAMRRVVEGERRLPVRIGVNRGTVFCGDVGPPSRRSYSVMGDAVNLAARVMAKAPAGTIYATAGVLDRSATRFATERLEPFAVKGKKQAVQAWSVGPAIGSRSREGVALRFPLVGRARELALLDEAVASVGRGAGRLVLVTGEPGIGKTRLVEELRERASGLTRLHATCEAYTTSTAYAAWRELLRPLIGSAWEDPDDVVLERLWAVVGTWDAELLPWVPLLALPFGTDMPPTRQVGELAPAFRRARLHDVVLRFLRDQLRGPTLIEIEDAHLMDAASADLLGGIAEQVGGEPWLVVAARRDTGAGFRARPGRAVVEVEPGPLDPAEALALAEAVTDDDPLPPHVPRLAAERSGGNPQFLRDLLRAVASDRDAPLPDSIETAAMARIDRLDDADRALVRRAAILGLSFHPRFLPVVLEGLVEPPDGATWGRLSSLFVDDGDGYLRFRRAVVRDAAYAGLPFGVRRRLHARVGERLEADAGPAADELAAILTVHFARARDHPRVWRYARLAGHSAHERLAFADAAQLFRHALEAGRAVDAPPEQLARVHEALADAQARTGELAQAHEALRAARRLVGADPLRAAGLILRHAQLAERAGHLPSAVRWTLRGRRELAGLDGEEAARIRARLLSLLATLRQRQGDREPEAIVLCRQAIAEAERSGEDAALAHACFILDWALFDSGRPEEATHSARALEIYERLGDLDRQAAVLNNLGGFAYHEGRWDDAVELYRRSRDASERAGDLANAAYGDYNVGEVLSDQGRWEEAEVELRRARRTWRGSGYESEAAAAAALLGRNAVRAGRHAEGLRLLEEAVAAARSLHAMSDAALLEGYLAEALAFAGEPARALDLADRLLPGAGRSAALLHRVRGFALSQLGRPEAARAALEASLSEARAEGSDYEAAVSLQALAALPGGPGRMGPGRTPDRGDVLLRRLQVAVLPSPPLERPASRRASA